MKSSGSSGGRRERGMDHVFNVIRLEIKVGGHLSNRLSSLEAIEHVLHPGAATDEDRTTESAARVDLNHRPAGDGQDQPLGPIVLSVGDPLQIVPDDRGEDSLPG
jgi:hypothetical protein